MAKLKEELASDKKHLANLEQLKQQHEELQGAEIRLDKCLTAVHQNLDQCTYKTKRLALEALDIKVTVTDERVDIQGVVPIDLVTIVQTSA